METKDIKWSFFASLAILVILVTHYAALLYANWDILTTNWGCLSPDIYKTFGTNLCFFVSCVLWTILTSYFGLRLRKARKSELE